MIERTGNDPNGHEALARGSRSYDAGMMLMDSDKHDERIELFREAERCYLEAAAKGNVYAWLCLGYVYSYDRCEGSYAPLAGAAGAADAAGAAGAADGAGAAETVAYPREQRAFDCFSRAAQAGLAEGCYKLGDMHKAGVGCTPDAGQGFAWYAEACRLAREEPPVIWGSAALRLASCYENGYGCQQSFSDALRWYRHAEAGLAIAVNDGEWYYERVLSRAQKGVQRMRQELHPE